MESRRRGPRALAIAAVVLAFVALILLYVTAPDPTVLVIRVIDAATGEPLYGASVRVQERGEQELPAATTDEDGIARFRNAPPGSTYVVRVQLADYDLVVRPRILVPESKTTTVEVPLSASQGERLYVGLEATRIAVIDTASLLPVATTRLQNWKQGAISQVRLHPERNLLYAVTSAEGRTARTTAPNAGVGSGGILRYDEIAVLNPDDNTTLGRFEVAGAVQAVTLSADGSHLLALIMPRGEELHTPSRGELLTLDAQTAELITRTMLADLKVPMIGPAVEYTLEPNSLAPEVEAVIPRQVAQLISNANTQELYVLHSGDPRLWVLDPVGKEVLRYITLNARLRGAALSADARFLYIVITDSGLSSWFPYVMTSSPASDGPCSPTMITDTFPATLNYLARTTVVSQEPGQELTTQMFCLYYDPNQRLRQPEMDDMLLTIRTDLGLTVMRQPIAAGVSAVAVSPTRPELYALNEELGTLSILDPAGERPPAVVAVGSEPVALVISADGNWAYVANRRSKTISAVYLPAATVIETIPLEGEPFSVALR